MAEPGAGKLQDVMRAVGGPIHRVLWKIDVEDFPAFILVDDKGNDFFRQICA